MKKSNKWLAALLVLFALPASAQMYVMDLAAVGSEYAIAMETRKEKIVIIIPPSIATGVSDVLERDPIGDFVSVNFIFTGRMRVVFPPRWFEFQDVNTKKRYLFLENDKTTITGLFADGSTVQFAFVGTAIGCPSTGCFYWVVGTETPALIRVPKPSNTRGHHSRGREGFDPDWLFTGPSAYAYSPIDMYDPFDIRDGSYLRAW